MKVGGPEGIARRQSENASGKDPEMPRSELAQRALAQGRSPRGMAKAFGYKVVELREGVIGGKRLGDKLEKVLNEHGRQGWQLKSVTAVEVKERLGPGWGRGGSRDIRTDDGQ